MTNETKTVVVLSYLGLILALVFAAPYLTIWSLNMIFGLQIPHDFEHWSAMGWLLLVLRGVAVNVRSSNN